MLETTLKELKIYDRADLIWNFDEAGLANMNKRKQPNTGSVEESQNKKSKTEEIMNFYVLDLSKLIKKFKS